MRWASASAYAWMSITWWHLRSTEFAALLLGFASSGTVLGSEAHYDQLNRYRTSEQTCNNATRNALPAFTVRPELEQAARDAANGVEPMQRLRRGTYRVQRTQVIGMS